MSDHIMNLEAEFFHALGAALERWQWVESSAYELYAAFMTGAAPRLISVSFHHIQSFDSSIHLLDRCAYFVVADESLTDRWNTLKKRMIKANQLRNRLAHFSVAENHLGEDVFYSLKPSSNNAIFAIRDKWKTPKNELRNNDLEKARYDFEKLARQIWEFKDDFSSIVPKADPTPKLR